MNTIVVVHRAQKVASRIRMAILLWLSGALVSSPLNAAREASGDWFWSADNPDAFYAGTVNDSSLALGQFCYPKLDTCVFAFDLGTKCVRNRKSPAIVSTDVGAEAIELVCGDHFERQILIAKNFKVVDEFVRRSKIFGIAVPLDGNEFKVVRFSLVGSTRALDRMRREAERVQALRRGIPKANPAEEIL